MPPRFGSRLEQLRRAVGRLGRRPSDAGPPRQLPARSPQLDSLFRRHPQNPILTARHWPYPVNSVFNPGVTTYDGYTLLLVRVEDRSGISHLTVARSHDGVSNWKIDSQPSFLPDPEGYEEAWGIEDPRVTKCGDEYLIVYTGYSRGGPLVCLASTRDFETFVRRGVLMSPEDKDAALFPQRFDGKWALIHRPVTSGSPPIGAHIWLSWSADLSRWGDHKVLLHARQGGWWNSNRIGLGPPPLLTDFGWLVLYHGVRSTRSGAIYRLGLAMLDRDSPDTVLVRGRDWVFGPQEPYERTGDVPNVVFPCGWVLDEEARTIRMYYGAADTSVCVSFVSQDELVAYLYQHCFCGTPHQPGDRCEQAALHPATGR